MKNCRQCHQNYEPRSLDNRARLLWLGLAHIKLLQDIICILALMHKGLVLSLLELQPKKEVQLTHYAHFNLLAHKI
jgi:hypothetical protein